MEQVVYSAMNIRLPRARASRTYSSAETEGHDRDRQEQGQWDQ